MLYLLAHDHQDLHVPVFLVHQRHLERSQDHIKVNLPGHLRKQQHRLHLRLYRAQYHQWVCHLLDTCPQSQHRQHFRQRQCRCLWGWVLCRWAWVCHHRLPDLVDRLLEWECQECHHLHLGLVRHRVRWVCLVFLLRLQDLVDSRIWDIRRFPIL